ncbi:MAG: 30S ribosomal protein S17 [Nanoarchaeota archaeon]|nr:30S ribosomal protein S17 [Nanoarchaeota archaeon]|tara:strand:+ start:4700 stop:5020 length:321 start_codon:yes stop_codon:yes gene_type:complete
MKQKLFDVEAPKKGCEDNKCPFHGKMAVKREFITGKVISKDTHHSATIEWARKYPVPKYERFEIRRSRIRVHNPLCINAEKGQTVLTARTRPMSKTKHYTIIKVEQ